MNSDYHLPDREGKGRMEDINDEQLKTGMYSPTACTSRSFLFPNYPRLAH
jgi:hypothetical protein